MIFLVLSIIFMVLLAVVTRAATQAGCNAISFSAIGRYVSGGAMLVFTFSTIEFINVLSALKASWIYGIIGAVLLAMSTIGATKAVQHGPLGISWTILRCSMVISTLCSIFVWQEVSIGLNRQFLLCMSGVFFTMSTVIVLGVSKLLEKDQKNSFSSKWLIYIMLAFLGQGFWEVAMRATRSSECAGFREVFICIVFLLAAISSTPAMKTIGRHNWKLELLWGGAFGLCGIFASGMRVWALKEIDGTIVFPVSTLCVTIAVQLLSVFVFKEQPGKLDVFAYLSSVLGIVCLALV